MTRKIALAIAGMAAIAIAQTPKTFEIVSIKPDRDGHGLDAGTQPGGRYTARNVPAQFLVTQAFGVKDFQISGAPKWLNDDRYDVVAKAATAKELTEEQLRPLLQAMLVDRFRLRFHKEMKEFPTYSLAVGKSGPKFHASAGGETHNLSVSSDKGLSHMTGQGMSVSELAKHLADVVGRSVSDDTGLKGNFDFKLAWASPDTVSETLPDIATAVQEQLGLKLNAIKHGAVEVIAIESMEKPSAN